MNKDFSGRFFTILLCLELILSPIAIAQGPQEVRKQSGVSTVLNFVNQNPGLLNPGQVNAPMNPLAKLQEQRKPLPDKYFNPNLMKVPGLLDYLNKTGKKPELLFCQTLPTTLTEVKTSVCEIGLSGGAPPEFQIQQMIGLRKEYDEIDKAYRNYSVRSNKGSELFGLGCMKNASEILDGFFENQKQELDLLLEQLKIMHAEYKNKLSPLLNSIEDAMAELGEGSDELKNRAGTRNNNLFNFKAQFDPACNSLFKGNELNRKKGINQILTDVQENFTAKGGATNYSAENYEEFHNKIKEGIKKFSQEASSSFESNFSAESAAAIDNQLDFSKFTSDKEIQGLSITGDFFTSIKNDYDLRLQDLTQKKKSITNSLGNIPNIDGAMGNKRTLDDFNTRILKLENETKSKCLNEAWNSMKDDILKNIYDPTISSRARRYGSNPFKSDLERIMSRNDLTIEQKLEEIQKSGKKFNRYVLKLSKSVRLDEENPTTGEIVRREIKATNSHEPSSFFSSIVNNCRAKFNSKQFVGAEQSPKEALQNMRKLNDDYLHLARSFSEEIKETIKKRLIECDNPQIANNTSPGSCSSERFDTTKPTFCANAALSCSRNMKQCNNQVSRRRDFLQNIKQEKSRDYNKLMEAYNNEFRNLINRELERKIIQGNVLNGIFQKTLNIPPDIKRNIWPGDGGDTSQGQSNNLFLKDFSNGETGGDGEFNLKLLNPDEFLKIFSENIKAIKESIDQQRTQITGGDNKGGGVLGEHISETKTNYDEVIKGAKEISAQCFEKYKEAGKYLAQNQAAQSRMGENQDAFCEVIRMGQDSPLVACSQLKSIINSALQSAQNPVAAEEVRNIRAYCASFKEKQLNAVGICALEEVKGSPPQDEYSGLKTECERMDTACSGKTVEGQTPNTQGCNHLKETVLAQYDIIFKKNLKEEFPTASAYCPSQDDGDRGNLLKRLNEIKDILNAGATES